MVTGVQTCALPIYAPADEVIGGIVEVRAKEILMSIERSLNDSNSVSVAGLRIPLVPPPIRIATEIPESHILTCEDLVKQASKYIDSGADIISIGFEALNPHPDKVRENVKCLKKSLSIPIAVDTSIPSEIDAAIESGADMVINIDLTNIDKVNRVERSVAVVVIPRDLDGNIPSDPMERAKLLEKAVEKAKSRGFEKVFADAILEPFGSTFKSLLAYYMFKQMHREIPMLIGIGNVTELIDADSVGVNASMIMLAQEVGASIALVVEKSAKAQGSTLEAKIASQMAAIAHYKHSPPKNLGISLLILKDKKRVFDEPRKDYDEVVYASDENKPYKLDPMGVFRIRVNHDDGYIEALYIGRKGRILIRGRSAKAIRQEIASRGLVSEISHALYLGYELAKAEIALMLGKNYVQEMPLFTKPRYIKLG